MKDYELKVTYLNGHFTRMWQRFAFFVTLQAALLAAINVSWVTPLKILVFALVGAVLSIIWFIIGAEDRYLVTAYREQLNAAGIASAQSVLSEAVAKSYETVGQLEFKSKELEEKLAQRCLLECITEKRWKHVSITRLPAWLALLAFLGWLAVLLVQTYEQAS
jgi:hypothetical protein